MNLHWVGFSYSEFDGYGRYCNRSIAALQRLGVQVSPYFPDHASMPAWLKRQIGIEPNTLTISCLPPYLLQKAPSGGRHWLLTMTEGSELPLGWREAIEAARVERVIVPCEHNSLVFRAGGVKAPIYVVPGGTCPDEFPVRNGTRPDRPYTFLALADRGARKGWTEVYSAFFKAFGKPDDAPDVRLIIKARPGGNELIDVMARCGGLDPRITITNQDVDIRELYASVDCFAIPSRCEGWGMPHREAAMMGLPVITQVHSGLDDGHTHEWAITLTKGHVEAIPDRMGHIKGEWIGADVNELAEAMYWCWMNPNEAAQKGQQAAQWLRANQTWDHSSNRLLNLIQEYS